MRTKDANSLVNMVRDASIFDISLISVVVLPIFLESWSMLLKQFDPNMWNKEICILIVLILIYIISVILMKYGQSKESKLKTAYLRIRSHYFNEGLKRYHQIEHFDATFLSC